MPLINEYVPLKKLTVKQREVMKIILSSADNGEFADMDQILDRIGYETTKSSMHFTIRTLIKHGLVVKRDGVEPRMGKDGAMKYKRIYIPTLLGYQMIRGRS